MPRVLIIDDSRFARLKLSENLKKSGFDILEASNGQEGLEVVKNQNLDIVLCDLLMPIMDGFGFLSALKEMNIPVPVLILTSDIQERTRRKALESGALDLLHKPPKYDEVIQKIHDILKEHR